MKKILSLITICFAITIYSYASDTTAVQKTINQVTQSATDIKNSIVSALPDSASLSFNKVYSDVKTGISALASSLKVGADHVYQILVLQQIVNAIMFAFAFIISIVFLFLAYRFWSNTKFGEGNNSDTMVGGRITDIIYFVIFFIAGLISLGTGLFHLDVIAMGFINPEYGAIKDIISFVK